MKLSPVLFLLVPCAIPIAVANDVVSGTAGDPLAEAGRLFADPNGGISVVGASFTADAVVAAGLGEAPVAVQFGVADGFEHQNGFVIVNGYVEDYDDDGAASGSPLGSANASGAVGGLCAGADPLLSAALTAAFGFPTPVVTEDAAVYEVQFTALAPTTLDVSYNFTTFETANGPVFFDSFGIWVDGGLIAGGTSKHGFAPGTDPWTLSPSAGPFPPSEYQSIPQGLWDFPAEETGRRTVTVALAVGAHTLRWSVADGGPGVPCPSGLGTGTCKAVPSALFGGLHTYRSNDPAGVSPGGPTIGRVGHPAPSAPAGAFPPDFQVTIDNATPASPLFLVQGGSVATPPIGLPILAPLEILPGPPLSILPAGVVGATGSAAFPPVPPTISPGIVGVIFVFQWFELSPGPTLRNTDGMVVRFGA